MHASMRMRIYTYAHAHACARVRVNAAQDDRASAAAFQCGGPGPALPRGARRLEERRGAGRWGRELTRSS